MPIITSLPVSCILTISLNKNKKDATYIGRIEIPQTSTHRWAAVHVLICHLCFYICFLLLLTMDTWED